MTNKAFFSKFYEGKIYAPGDRTQIGLQLGSDSHLFIEGWVFERKLAEYFRTDKVILGPRYPKPYNYITDVACLIKSQGLAFYKIVETPEAGDRVEGQYRRLAARLKSKVFLVTEAEHALKFRACPVDGRPTTWTHQARTGGFYSTTNIDPGRQAVAIKHLLDEFSSDELRLLSIKRLLMNCFLSGSKMGYPVDIDAILCSDNGSVAIVENKRKDTDSVGWFGLDEKSAYLIYKFCEKEGIDYLLVNLHDPVTKKRSVSPLILFKSPRDWSRLNWCCTRLTRHGEVEFVPKATRTRDGHGDIRTPNTFDASIMSVVGRGFSPATLNFLPETTS